MPTEDGVDHGERATLDSDGLARSKAMQWRLRQHLVLQATAQMFNNLIGDHARCIVLLQNAADAWRPSNGVPSAEAFGDLEEDVAWEHPSGAAITDAARLGAGRCGELRCVAFHLE